MKLFLSVMLTLVLTASNGCTAKEQAAEEANTGQPVGQSNAIPYKGVVSEIANVQQIPDRAPDFAWRNTAGKRVTFKEFHKTVTVVNFWATWCGPCRREIPDLQQIHNEYAAKGVQVIGISVDRGPSVLNDVAEFAVKFKMTYPVVIDNGELERIYGNIRAIPTTFVINKDGKIVERLIGMRPKEVFLKSILPHLK